MSPRPGWARSSTPVAREAGIDNTLRVRADWMDASDIEGDVVFSDCIAYFVWGIVPSCRSWPRRHAGG